MVLYYSSMRRIGGRVLLVLLGLALGVAAIELALRVAGPNVPLDLTMARFQAYHPEYGFFHRPGVSGWLRTSEFTSYVKFNAQGLRGPEVSVPKPTGTFRVVVLGDSVVEGAQVAQDLTFAALLAGEIEQRTNGVRVGSVNAGVAGFGTGQQLLFLQREGEWLDPDLVVLVFTISNDVADNGVAVARRWKLAAERRPFFVVDPSGELRQLPFQPPPPESFEALRSFMRDRSVLFNAVDLWAVGKSVARAQGSVVPPLEAEKEVYLRELNDDWREAWDVTDRLLAEVDRVGKRLDAPLVVVLSPTSWQMNEAAWRDLIGSGSQAARRFAAESPNERLAEIAERRGLQLIDMLDPFRRETAAGVEMFFRRDGHWTVQGHAVAAREVAAYLVARELVR